MYQADKLGFSKKGREESQEAKEESEEEEENDVIYNGFNNYLSVDEERSTYDVAHLLSGMSQEYIFTLLGFLKVC